MEDVGNKKKEKNDVYGIVFIFFHFVAKQWAWIQIGEKFNELEVGGFLRIPFSGWRLAQVGAK